MLRFTFLMLCGCFVQPTFYHQPEAQHLLPFRSAKMGHEADYPIWFAHGRAASCRLFMRAFETRQDSSCWRASALFSSPCCGDEPAVQGITKHPIPDTLSE